jgi:hypothetical protein
MGRREVTSVRVNVEELLPAERLSQSLAMKHFSMVMS